MRNRTIGAMVSMHVLRNTLADLAIGERVGLLRARDSIGPFLRCLVDGVELRDVLTANDGKAWPFSYAWAFARDRSGDYVMTDHSRPLEQVIGGRHIVRLELSSLGLELFGLLYHLVRLYRAGLGNVRA